jgi:hypothetical protein
MGQLAVNAKRFDPYEGFRFRLKWGGRHVAGLSHCSGLEGGATITLERGTTHDFEFFRWSGGAWTPASGGADPEELRRDLVIELYSESDELVAAYALRRAWPSGFVALPDLDARATATAMAIERIALEHEGCERVADTAPPR